jgi:cell division protein FtsN
MLALVIVLHLLLIAAVLYASPFDGHHGNHAHQNLPLAPEDKAADEMATAAAAVGGRRRAWGSAALSSRKGVSAADRALVEERAQDEEEGQNGEQDEEEEEQNEEEYEEERDEEEEGQEQGEAEAEKPRAAARAVVKPVSAPAASASAAAAAAAAPEEGQRPEAFDECGVWQEGYMDLHRKILAGEAPQRYLVAVAYKGGLADQLVGIVTAFYWALVSYA